MKMRAEDEVERLLSQATAERARGNFLAARRLLEQALEKAPTVPTFTKCWAMCIGALRT